MSSISTHFYEVLPKKLYAGSCPWKSLQETSHVHELYALGIRDFLTLREDLDISALQSTWSLVYPDISILQFPIRDFSVPDSAIFDAIILAMKEYVRLEKTIYVSCALGLGRTGLIISCFLAEHIRISGEKALELMNEQRNKGEFMVDSDSPETQEQIKYVMSCSFQSMTKY